MIKITKKRLHWLIYFMGAYWHPDYDILYKDMQEALADFHRLMPQDIEQAFIAELAPIAKDPQAIAFMNRPDSMDRLARLSGGAYVSGDDIRFIHDYLVKNRRFPQK